MLQNMSADNLASMENTVGTVVTILEYIDRLDSSLEEINGGSTAIGSIINSVDDAAGQSAHTARHMNSSMDEIRERNVDISRFSQSTQVGVSSLQQSMREVAQNLRQFKIEDESIDGASLADLEEVTHISEPTRVYGEDEMSAMEAAASAKESVASV